MWLRIKLRNYVNLYILVSTTYVYKDKDNIPNIKNNFKSPPPH